MRVQSRSRGSKRTKKDISRNTGLKFYKFENYKLRFKKVQKTQVEVFFFKHTLKNILNKIVKKKRERNLKNTCELKEKGDYIIHRGTQKRITADC